MHLARSHHGEGRDNGPSPRRHRSNRGRGHSHSHMARHPSSSERSTEGAQQQLCPSQNFTYVQHTALILLSRSALGRIAFARQNVHASCLAPVLQSTSHAFGLNCLLACLQDRVECSGAQMAEVAQKAEQITQETGQTTRVVGWYHSHPHITVLPSHIDVDTQVWHT